MTAVMSVSVAGQSGLGNTRDVTQLCAVATQMTQSQQAECRQR